MIITFIAFNNHFLVLFLPCLGDSRSYSYVIGLSTSDDSPDWQSLLFLAKLIPRILHNINRVCYIFGGTVQYPITDITHTRISRYSLAQLRQADDVATSVCNYKSNCLNLLKIPQLSQYFNTFVFVSPLFSPINVGFV